MRILPREEYKIQTPFSKDKAESVMRLKTTKEKYRFGRTNPDKLFHGEVNDDNFSISRIIQGRNSFLPVVRGKILECGKGAKLIMEFTVDPAVSAIYICCLCFCGIFFLLSLYAIISGHNFISGVIISLLMALYVYCLARFSFNREASKVKKMLCDLLLADYL